MRERGVTSLVVLATVIAITMVWWALALWPVSDAPVWLERTRYVCFGTRPNGLPDAAGWTALILQPILMLGTVWVIWGRSLARAFMRLRHRPAGRAVLAGAMLVVLVAVSAATWRVGSASAAGVPWLEAPVVFPETYPRLDRAAPAMALVDQHGDTLRLGQLRGEVTLVTFAFGHCQTICPAIVRDVLVARRRLATTRAVNAIVVTLDPWRDIPSRLPYLASKWELGTDEFIVSGAVDDVEAVLDGWGVPRQRDPLTGDVTHPALAYIVTADGTIAFGVRGGVEAIVELAGRL